MDPCNRLMKIEFRVWLGSMARTTQDLLGAINQTRPRDHRRYHHLRPTARKGPLAGRRKTVEPGRQRPSPLDVGSNRSGPHHEILRTKSETKVCRISVLPFRAPPNRLVLPLERGCGEIQEKEHFV